MRDPIDFYRQTHRARWDRDNNIVIERRGHEWASIVRDGFLGLVLIVAALAACITGLQ